MVWTSAVGVTVNGNSLTKTAANGWGNAGAVSTQQIASGDGYVEFTASETTTYRMLGLSNGNTNTSYEDIDFAIDAYAGGQIQVYENGTSRAPSAPTPPATSSASPSSAESSSTPRTEPSSTPPPRRPTYPLLVDTALYNTGRHAQQRRRLGDSVGRPRLPLRVRRDSLCGISVTPISCEICNKLLQLCLRSQRSASSVRCVTESIARSRLG